jgi:hypothetical protein
MKPINTVDAARGKPAPPAPPLAAAAGGAPAAAAAPVPLSTIDVSSLDRLVALRQEKAKIDGFRARAEEKKADVSPAVYKRVIEDYTRRADAFDQQGAPLRAQARAEYRKLKALIQDVDRRLDQARLQKDEIEFRHTVGELSDEDYDKQITEHVGNVLDPCEAERKALDETKARFIEALGSEQALEAAEPAPRRESPAPPPPPPPPAPRPPVSSETIAVVPDTDPATGPAIPADAADVTAQLPPIARRIPGVVDQPARPSSPVPPARADVNATMILASAAVMIVEPASMSQDFQLGAVNGIGRADENQICLLNNGVSRKHAVIRAVPGGFSITDLKSQNGTFINGQRITESLLADGDTIDVGDVKLVFRMPWTVSPPGTPGRPPARQGNR